MPLLQDFHASCLITLKQVAKKSEIAGAIHYALARWQALTRFAHGGRIEIDNKAAVRTVRAVALGRKNDLFAGSDSGGERAAAMYALIGACKTQRRQLGKLSVLRAHAHRRASDQSH